MHNVSMDVLIKILSYMDVLVKVYILEFQTACN